MQTIYLDISNKGVVPAIYAKQNDVGRKFKAVLTDAGVPYSIPSGAVFSVFYSGNSGEGNYTHIDEKSAFSVSGNSVVVELIAQMLINAGEGLLCLVLSESNGKQIGLWNIPYIAESVPGATSEEAVAYYTAFAKTVKDLMDAQGGGNNQILSDGSFAYGNGNIAGLLGYYYYHADGEYAPVFDVENNKLTLYLFNDQECKNPAGDIAWQSGDVVSIVNGTKYELCAEIESVSGNKIVLNALPFTSVVTDSNPNFDDWSISVPAKPEAGVVDLGRGAVAIGDSNKALNWGAASIGGRDNIVTAQYGVAVGRQNKVNGYCGFAAGMGHEVKAGTRWASTFGAGNKATADCQTVVGKNNIEDPDALFIVGNGTANNAFVVKKDGTVYAIGTNAKGEKVTAKLVDSIELGFKANSKAWPTKNLNDRYDANWNEIGNGFYKLDININNAPPISAGDLAYANMLHWRSGNTTSQIVIPIYPNAASVWFRTGNENNGLSDWLLLSNPPMLIGVEYLTSERYNGKPVYKKIISIGALPNAYSKIVDHGIRDAKSFISIDVMAYDTNTTTAVSFPFVGTDGDIRGRIHVTSTGLYLYTYSNLSNYTAVATLSYIKD